MGDFNPWDVDSLEAFACLKCPECDFDAKFEGPFQNHAVENHPLSCVFFGLKPKIKQLKSKEAKQRTLTTHSMSMGQRSEPPYDH